MLYWDFHYRYGTGILAFLISAVCNELFYSLECERNNLWIIVKALAFAAPSFLSWLIADRHLILISDYDRLFFFWLTCSVRGRTSRVHGTCWDTAGRCRCHPVPTHLALRSSSGSSGTSWRWTCRSRRTQTHIKTSIFRVCVFLAFCCFVVWVIQ